MSRVRERTPWHRDVGEAEKSVVYICGPVVGTSLEFERVLVRALRRFAGIVESIGEVT